MLGVECYLCGNVLRVALLDIDTFAVRVETYHCSIWYEEIPQTEY